MRFKKHVRRVKGTATHLQLVAWRLGPWQSTYDHFVSLCVATSVSTFIKFGCTGATCTCICARTQSTHDHMQHRLHLPLTKPYCRPRRTRHKHLFRPTGGLLLA